ncbi:MAG: hypothetical protein K2K84_05700 [Muribaculaceae bacterium]|nr:hypothetical protein [Muribaculaceae bacterium]
MDFIELYSRILDDLRSVREAEKEFSRQLDSDTELSAEFDQWCNDNGYRRRSEALNEIADQLLEQRESVWNSLKDYDNEE